MIESMTGPRGQREGTRAPRLLPLRPRVAGLTGETGRGGF